MTQECKKVFTLRISQANKTEMIVILYEMIESYLEDAREAYKDGDRPEYRNALRRVRGCINELIASLDLNYNLALHLLQLYLYCNKELAAADIRWDKGHLDHIAMVIHKLLLTYRELAKLDESGPVMSNSQTVYAGLTYGRDSLTENMADQGANRGVRV